MEDSWKGLWTSKRLETAFETASSLSVKFNYCKLFCIVSITMVLQTAWCQHIQFQLIIITYKILQNHHKLLLDNTFQHDPNEHLMTLNEFPNISQTNSSLTSFSFTPRQLGNTPTFRIWHSPTNQSLKTRDPHRKTTGTPRNVAPKRWFLVDRLFFIWKFFQMRNCFWLQESYER